MARQSILIPAALLAAGAALWLDGKRRERETDAARRAEAGGPEHRVVIAGAGFGGLEAARRLGRVPGLKVTLLDEHNHHLFQPLLYQVATSALAPDDIASPVRSILPLASGVEVLMDRVTGLDLAAREVECGARRVPYDTLVVATGSEPSYFGHDDWRDAAPGLKTLDDALELRRRILGAFEAAAASDAAERERHLTFLVIGGGTTGVEMAGSLAELAQEMLNHEFRDLSLPWRERRARVLLVEGGDRLLPGFPSDLSERAVADLHHLGVEVRTGAKVTTVARGRAQVGTESIPAGTVVWAAGVAATPVAEWLGVKPGHGGRVLVGPDLQVPERPGIYVIGDAAQAPPERGKPLPGVAPVAKQQGAYVARAIGRRMRGQGMPRPFRYRDYGTLATVGRGKALVKLGPVHLTGFVAWVTWAVAHIFFLIGFRNRVLVSAQWLFAYVTRRRAGRVIT